MNEIVSPAPAPLDSPRSPTSRHADAWWQLGLAAVGFLLAWVLTSPQLLLVINWDNAAYVASAAMGKLTWAAQPWNNHFGVGHIEYLFFRLGTLLGGTPIDGFRLCGATFFALTSGLFAKAAFCLCRQRALTVALSLVFMTSWVNTVLIQAIEWNVYFLAPASAIILLSLSHHAHWRWQHSVATGLLGAGAVLISWQASVYLFPAGYAAFFGGLRGRSTQGEVGVPRGLLCRLRDVALILASFGAGLVSWSLLVAATSSQTVRALLRVQFSRPEPSVLPHNAKELLALLSHVPAQLHSTGVAAAFMFHHDFNYHLPRYFFPYEVYGAIATLGVIALFVLCTYHLLRRHDLRLHMLATTLLVLLFLTSLWHEFPAWQYAQMKRYNFLPLLVWLIVAGLLRDGESWRRGRSLLLGGLLLLSLVQLGLCVRFAQRWHSIRPELPSYIHTIHPENAWYGRDGRSWFAYFRRLREQHPSACSYVFAFEEIMDGRWNFDIMASLSSELPSAIVLGNPAQVAKWRFPPRIFSVASAREQGLIKSCAYLSKDAQELLGP